MTRAATKRKQQARHPAVAGLDKPPAAPERVTIPLKRNDWRAVLSTWADVLRLRDQQKNLLQSLAAAEREHAATLAEIERDYGLGQGAFERGEYALENGEIVSQRPQQQATKDESQRTGTDG